jgi:hypothetical protein
VALTFDDSAAQRLLPSGARMSDSRATPSRAAEAPHPALVRLHQRLQARDAIRRRAALQDLGERRTSARQSHLSHIDLTKNRVEDFQREILRNEPALELLMRPSRAEAPTGAGSAIHTSTRRHAR